MVNTEQLTRIQTRVSGLIDDYGNTITLKSQGTPSVDSWKQTTYSGQTSTQTVGVTDNYMVKKMRITEIGRFPDADLLVVIKGDETIDETYTVTVDSQDYNIIGIEKLQAANVIVAYQLALGVKA